MSEAAAGRSAPPRFGLSFIEGRALVGFARRPLADWLRVLDFSLEVPDVTFPFDVTAGAETFRHRRCRVVGLCFEADEEGLVAHVKARLVPALEAAGAPVADVEIAFAEGFVEVAGTVLAGRLDTTGNDAGTPGEPVPFTFKVAVDASTGADVRLLVHDPRLWAPATLPAPAVAVMVLSAISGGALPVEVDPPASLRLDPIPTFLRDLLPRHGWKLPESRHVRLSATRIEPGRARLFFDGGRTGGDTPDAERQRGFLSALEGSLAFAAAERALAEGRFDDARDGWLEAEGPLPDHPFAAERLLALFVADPATLDDAADLADACLARDAAFVPALWARALVRAHRGEPGAARDLLAVSDIAESTGEVLGAHRAALAAGRLAEKEADTAFAASDEDEGYARLAVAATAFERGLGLRRDDHEAFAALSRIYPRLADLAAARRILEKRLRHAGTDAEQARLHLDLGRLHAGHHDALGVPPDPERRERLRVERGAVPFEGDPTRAKLHLDAALRHAPDLADAWIVLGHACAAAAEPLRAVRCLDRGRELLVAEGRAAEAAAAARTIATLWERELGHEENAVLRYRQVLETFPDDYEARLRHAELSLALGHVTDAESGLSAALDTIRRLLQVAKRDGARPGAGASAREKETRTLAAAGLRARRSLAHIARAHYGAHQAAVDHLEAALSLSGPAGRVDARREILADLVAACEQAGDPARLLDACDRAAEAETDDGRRAAFLAQAAELALDGGDVDGARRRVAAARALDPEGHGPRRARVRLEAMSGSPKDHAAALDDLARHTADPAERAGILLALGELRLTALDSPGAALAPLESARDDAASAEDALAAARLHLRAARMASDARGVSASLVALSAVAGGEEAAGALLEAAALHEEDLDDPAGARTLLEEARRLAPSDPRPAWHLGRLHHAAGDATAAWSVFLDLAALGGPAAAGIDEGTAARILGEAALAAGDAESAAAPLSAAARHAPLDEAVETDAVDVLERLERPDALARLLGDLAEARRAAGDRAGAAARHRRAAAVHETGRGDAAAAIAALEAAVAAVLSADEAEALLAAGHGAPDDTAHGEARAAAEDLLRLCTGDANLPIRAAARLHLAALATDPAEGAEHLALRAADLFEADEEAAALESLDRAVALDPDRADLRETLAGHLAAQDPEGAADHLEWLLANAGEDDPARALTWRSRAADAALAAGDDARAAHHLGVYVAHRPGDDVTVARYADLLRDAGRWRDLHDVLVHRGESILSAPDAVAGDEGAAALLEAARIAAERLDRPDLARGTLETLLERIPDHRPALEALLPLIADRPYAALRASVLDALADGTDDAVEAAVRRAEAGRAHAIAGNVEAAAAAFEAALALDPDRVDAAEGLARLAWRRHDLSAFARACAVRADQATGAGEADAAMRHLVVARLHLDLLGDAEAGLAALDRALEDDRAGGLDLESQAEAWRRRLGCHLAAGDSHGAIADLGALLGLAQRHAAPDVRAALHRRRGGLREAVGDAEGGREDWTEAHRLDPGDPVALERLMRLAEEDGDLPLLVRLHAVQARQALASGRSADAARALAERARLLAGPLGDPEAAVRDLEQAAALGVDGDLRAGVRLALREACFALGRTGAAIDVALDEAAVMPATTAAHHLLACAEAADATGDPEAALRATRAAWKRAETEPAVAAATFARLFAAGAVEEAAAPARALAACDPVEIARALDRGETEADALLRAAALLLDEAGDEGALPLLERLAAGRPGDGLVVDRCVSLAEASGDLATARRILAAHRLAVPRSRRRRVALRLADLAAAAGDVAAEASWLREAFTSPGHSPDATDRRRILDALLRAGDTAAYVSTAGEAITEHLDAGRYPVGVEALADHVGALLDNGASDAALDLLGRFDDLRGDVPELLVLWRRAAEAAGRTEVVVEALESLVQQRVEEGDDAGAAEVLADLGRLHEDAGDPEAAARAWHEALLRGLDDGDIRLRALEAARAIGDPSFEADLLELCIEAAGDDATARLVELAAIYADRLDAPARAEAALREALSRDGAFVPAETALEALLRRGGRHGDLAALYRARADRSAGADRALALLEAAAHAGEAGRPEDAVADLLAARDADPSRFEADGGAARLDGARATAGLHRDRAEARLATPDGADAASRFLEAGDILRDKVGDLEAAEAAYRRAFESGAGQRAAERLRALLGARDDHLGLARLAREEARGAPPGPVRAGLLRSAGDLFEKGGDPDGAIAAWTDALDDAPTDAFVLERLQGALEAAGRHGELAGITRRLAEGAAGAERAGALVRAALLHGRAGDPEAALACLLEAEEADPAHEEAVRRLADALWDADRKDESVDRYRRLLPREPLGSHAHERVAVHLSAAGRIRELAEVTVSRAAAARAADDERLALDLYLKAYALWGRANEPSAGRAAAVSAFHLDPGDRDAFEAALSCARESDDPAWEVEVLEAHVDALPPDADGRLARLRALVEARARTGDVAGARADLAAYVSLAGDAPEALSWAAAQTAEDATLADVALSARIATRLLDLAEAGTPLPDGARRTAHLVLAGAARGRDAPADALVHLEAALSLTFEPAAQTQLAEQLASVAERVGDATRLLAARRRLADLADDPGKRREALRATARAAAAAGDTQAARVAWEDLFDLAPDDPVAYAALAAATEGIDAHLDLLARHAAALTEPTARRDRLLEIVLLARDAGDEKRATRAALEAFRLDPRHLRTAWAALPALRVGAGGTGPAELALALEVVAEAAAGEEALVLWTEAAERRREAGDPEAAHRLAGRAVDLAEELAGEGGPAETGARTAQAIREAVRVAVPLETSPTPRARLHRLAARVTSGAPRAGHLVDAAEAWLQAGDGGEAFADLKAATAAAPADPRAPARLLELHLEAGDLPAAANAAESLARAETDDPREPLVRVADAADAAGHPDLVSSVLALAVELDATDVDLCDRLVEARLAAGDAEGAARAAALRLDRLARRDVDAEVLVESAARVARLYEKAGDAPEAATAWEDVLDRDPGHVEAADALDRWHRDRKSFADLVAMHLARSERLATAGRAEAAADAALDAAAAARDDGDDEGAVDAVRRALARRPGHPAARAWLERLVSETDDDALAVRALEADLETAEEGAPRARAALTLAGRHHAAGRTEEAATTYRAALRAADGGDDTDGWVLEVRREAGVRLAAAALEGENAEEALALARMARDAGAGEPGLVRILARAAEAEGDLFAALAAWRSLADADPHDMQALEGQVRCAGTLGDLDAEIAGREGLAEAAGDGPGAADRWLDLAARLDGAGRPSEAAAARDRALDAAPEDRRIFEAVLALLEEREDAAGRYALWRRRARAAEDEGERAEAFFEAGRIAAGDLDDPEGAIEAFSRCLAIDDDHQEARAALADVHHRRGEVTRAEPLLRALTGGTASLPAFAVHQRLGDYAASGGRHTEALAAYWEAARMNPTFVDAWMGIRDQARILGDDGSEADALEGLLGALPADDREGRVETFLSLATIEARRGDLEAAAQHQAAAHALAPDDPAIALTLAELHVSRSRFDAAAAVFTTLAEMASTPRQAAERWTTLADLHGRQLQDKLRADEALARAVAADPAFAPAWALRLESAVEAGDGPAIAEAALRLEALGEADAAAEHPAEVGRALLSAGEILPAARHLEAACAARPDDRQLAAEAASACIHAGAPERAVALLDALAERTGAPVDRRAAAEAALCAGDGRGYVRRMSEGLTDPDLGEPLQARALRGIADRLAGALGDPEGAVAVLERLVAERPDDRAARHELALRLAETGRIAEARDALVSLCRADPADPATLTDLAGLLEAVDPDRARGVSDLAGWLRITVPGDGLLPVDVHRPQAADPAAVRIDDILRLDLADPVAAGPMGWFMRAVAPLLEPLFPADLARYGVTSDDLVLPVSHPAAARARAWSEALGGRAFNLYRGERLGFEICIENTRPVSLLVGGAILEGPEWVRDQVLCRAVDLVSAGYALPGKFAGADLGTLVRLALSFFDPDVRVPIPADKVALYHEAMANLCPPEKKAALAPLAQEAKDALPRFDPAAFAPALERTADRIALLCTGDAAGAVETALRLDRRRAGEAIDRREAVRSSPALFDLCRFVLRDDAGVLHRAVRGE